LILWYNILKQKIKYGLIFIFLENKIKKYISILHHLKSIDSSLNN